MLRILFLLSCLTAVAYSVCCGGGICADCYKPGPTGCCGKGRCNIFCCHCTDGCRQPKTDEKQELDVTKYKFVSIDLDHSHTLEHNEIASFMYGENDKVDIDMARVRDVMKGLDSNGDGKLQPYEFDQDLNDKSFPAPQTLPSKAIGSTKKPHTFGF